VKIGFVTCVELGLSCLEKISAMGGRLDAIVTLHDDIARQKSGRVYLDSFCDENQTQLHKIRHINDADSIELLKALSLDWLFIIGWSQIASKQVLETTRLGVLGMHPTLLPEGRGRAAIPWAIIRDLSKTGVTLFKLDEGVDTGPIVDQYVIPLTTRIDAKELYEKVNEAHVSLIEKVWQPLVDGRIELKVQDESQATIWAGRTPVDGRLVPDMSIAEADRLIRATTRPYPGAWISFGDKQFIIWKADIKADRISSEELSTAWVLSFTGGELLCLDYEEIPIANWYPIEK